MAGTRMRPWSLRPTRASISQDSGSGLCLYLRNANSKESDRQFPTAAASNWTGDGPCAVPRGAGSSASKSGTPPENTTVN